MAANPINELTDNSMKNLRALVDSNTVIGNPVTTPDGTTILPVSKVSFGFGTGGSDLPATQKELFGGGAGGGVSITPIAFLVVKDGMTRVLPVAVPPVSTVDRIVEMTPDLMDKVEKYFDKKKETP